MHVSFSEIPDTASAGEIADVLGVSTRRVRQLAHEAIIPRAQRGAYLLEECIRNFVAWKRQDFAKRAKRSSDEMLFERVRKLKFENDETERQIVRTENAVAAIDAIVASVKSELSAIAPRVTDDISQRRQVADQVAVVTDALDARYRVAVADLRMGRDALAPVNQLRAAAK